MEITKRDITKLIEVQKNDNILNHLLTIIKKDYRAKGEIKSSELKIWSQSYMTGITYPVFTFKLNSKNQLIDIKDKLNPIGRIFYISFLIFLAFLFTPSEFNNINWSGYFPLLMTTIIFLGIFILLSVKYYRFETKQQLDEIFEILDIETEPEKAEKEWSTRNILIRLFTYPFCIFLIGLNVFLIIPEGKFGLTLGTIIFVGLYLYTDLKMIFRKKTTGNIGYRK